MMRALACLVTWSLLGACAAERPNDRVMRRDSLEVTIVESFSPAWEEGESWSVAAVPVLDLATSGEGPNHEFFLATDATRLSDGSFVVADDGDDEIRIFSPTGVYVRTLGRTGDGPGEFRRLSQVIALSGDSILAYDYWQARITVFDPDRDMARILTLEGAYRPRPLLPVESGGFVGMSTDFTGFGDEPGLHRLPSPIVRIGQPGEVVDTLTTIAGFETVVFGRGDARALWGKNSHLAVHGDDVYLGSADSLGYEVWSASGRLMRLVRVPGYDLALSSDEIEAELNAFLPDPAAAGPIMQEIMDEQPDRTHRPAYSQLVVDVSGYVWLGQYKGRHETSEPVAWQAFDPTGEWLGPVTLPAGFRVFRIGEDWILGKRPDELDVEHIQLLRLSRGPDA